MPTRVPPGDEYGELERVGQAQLRQVFRGGHRHEDVAALQRPGERRVRRARRAQPSSSPGAETGTSRVVRRAESGRGSLVPLFVGGGTADFDHWAVGPAQIALRAGPTTFEVEA